MRGHAVAPNNAKPAPAQQVEVEVLVNEANQTVRIAFWPKIDNLTQTSAQAVALAKALLEGAKRLDPKSVEGITWV